MCSSCFFAEAAAEHTYEERCHYRTMDRVEQMGFHTHPTATEGKTYQSMLPAAQNTHAHTHTDTTPCKCTHSVLHTDEHIRKHLLFICTSFWNITHLSSKYFFLATAWMDAGTRGKPWTGERWPPYEVLSEFSEIHLSFMQQ